VKAIKVKLEVCKSHVASRDGDVIEMIQKSPIKSLFGC